MTKSRQRLMLFSAVAVVFVLAVLGGRALVDAIGSESPASSPTAMDKPLPPAPTPSNAVPTDSPASNASTKEALRTAAAVVESMYSVDHTDAGPNAWLSEAKPLLTRDAYAWYAQALGRGPGSTTTPFWREMEEEKGHRRVIAGTAHVDGESATNTPKHLTVMVPFTVESEGVPITIEYGDPLAFVNLDQGADGRWKVSAVLEPTSLPENYGAFALRPLRGRGAR